LSVALGEEDVLVTWDRALTTLVRLRGAELKRYGYLLAGDDGEAEDLVPDALIRTFTYPRRDEVLDLEWYVRKVMLNLFLDRARRRGRWKRLVLTTLADRAGPLRLDPHW
jgi:DNA-directed RNA polymerase specialized sigma24 family protein